MTVPEKGMLRVEPTIHLVIFRQPYLDYILSGAKTVESRFLMRRGPPYNRVQAGDRLVLKQAGGPLRACARVAEVQYYADLTPATLHKLLDDYASQLCLEPDFAAQLAGRRYAVLITLAQVQTLDPPLPLHRRDGRGWVVLDATEQAPWTVVVRQIARGE